MAEGGSFNISQLVRELGLKAVSAEDLRILETIQPVLIAGDLSRTTPPHEQPAALLAARTDGAIGRRGMFEVQCLAPGGAFVGWIVFSTLGTTSQIRVVTTPSGVATVSPGAGQLSRAPIRSILRIGDVPATGAPSLVLTSGFTAQAGFADLYVPNGAFFQIEHATDNVLNVDIGIHWREVLAAENVPG